MCVYIYIYIHITISPAAGSLAMATRRCVMLCDRVLRHSTAEICRSASDDYRHSCLRGFLLLLFFLVKLYYVRSVALTACYLIDAI